MFLNSSMQKSEEQDRKVMDASGAIPNLSVATGSTLLLRYMTKKGEEESGKEKMKRRGEKRRGEREDTKRREGKENLKKGEKNKERKKKEERWGGEGR